MGEMLRATEHKRAKGTDKAGRRKKLDGTRSVPANPPPPSPNLASPRRRPPRPRCSPVSRRSSRRPCSLARRRRPKSAVRCCGIASPGRPPRRPDPGEDPEEAGEQPRFHPYSPRGPGAVRPGRRRDGLRGRPSATKPLGGPGCVRLRQGLWTSRSPGVHGSPPCERGALASSPGLGSLGRCLDYDARVSAVNPGLIGAEPAASGFRREFGPAVLATDGTHIPYYPFSVLTQSEPHRSPLGAVPGALVRRRVPVRGRRMLPQARAWR
jgi:hypothetical protein